MNPQYVPVLYTQALEFDFCALEQEDLWVKPNEQVHAFSGANQTIGTLVFKFASQSDAVKATQTTAQWLAVNVG